MHLRDCTLIRQLRPVVHAFVAAVVFAVLLVFPAARPHSLTNHFRTPEVRNSIQRHTSLGDTRTDVSPQIATEYNHVSDAFLLADGGVEPARRLNESPPPPQFVLRVRMKLGNSRVNSTDPLL
jgi:hypothetical protein